MRRAPAGHGPIVRAASLSMTVSELRRQELLVRLPHAVLAVLAVAGAAVLARAFAQPGILAMPDLVAPSDGPNWAARFLLPAAAPLALELVLGGALALVSGVRRSFTLELTRRSEHLVASEATAAVEQVLARLTRLGFDGRVEQTHGKTVIAVARPRSHPFRGFDGLPLEGTVTVEEIAGVSHVCASLSIATFIVRDTGEALYLTQLAEFLAGHADTLHPVRGPAVGMNFAVGYAALGVALAAIAVQTGSLSLAVYADSSSMLGLAMGGITSFAIVFQWRTVVGLPETIAAIAAALVTRLVLVGVSPGL